MIEQLNDVWIPNGSNLGYKVISTFVMEDDDLYVVQPGKVVLNRFVPMGHEPLHLSVLSEEELKGDRSLWVPARFKKGDFLTNSIGRTFYYEDESRVWSLSNPGGNAYYSTLSAYEDSYGTLQRLERGSTGEGFRINENGSVHRD